MKKSIKTGFNFGLTSGIITTLGLMVGLKSVTNSKMVVIGGILTIAIADALSDGLGMHISQESENDHTTKEVWESTISTVVSKFIFALTFLIPVLALELSTAIIVSIIWGLALISLLSLTIARKEKKKPAKVIAEHVLITVIVIISAYYAGKLMLSLFSYS